MVNWQLSKQDSHWPVSHDHIAGSCVNSWRWRNLFGSCPLTSYYIANNVQSHTFELVWVKRKTENAHIGHPRSIDSCQNRVPADQYQLTVSRAQVTTQLGQVFFEVIRWQVTSFQEIAGSSLIFFKFIWSMLCLCAAQLNFLFQTDLGRENSASCYRQWRQLLLTFPTHGHALVTLYVQFSYSDWSKFDRWVHAQNLCSILILVYFDSWSWQSFLSTCQGHPTTIFGKYLFGRRFET